MSAIPQAASGCVTGIGSLPHVGAAEAVEVVAEVAPEVPWWPQLPRRTPHEGMIRQFLGAGSNSFEPRPQLVGYALKEGERDGLVRWLETADAALDDVNAAGFSSFLDALNDGKFPAARLLKGQITGPVTLSRYLFVGTEAGIRDSEFVAALASRLARCAADQVRRLGAFGLPVTVWIDEPGAGHLRLDEPPLGDSITGAVTFILDAIRKEGGIAGLHCCSPVRTSWVRTLAPDILSFDAGLDRDLVAGDEDIAAWVAGGGSLAPGIADPMSGQVPDLDAATSAALATGLRTPSCGLATTEPANVSSVFAAIREAGPQPH